LPSSCFSGLKNAEFHKHIDIPADAVTGLYHLHLAVTDQQKQMAELLPLRHFISWATNLFSILKIVVISFLLFTLPSGFFLMYVCRKEISWQGLIHLFNLVSGQLLALNIFLIVIHFLCTTNRV
jgi:hypothetical protein